MLNFKTLAVMAAASTLLPSALATFDSSANTNMAVYWGQGPDQEPLEFFCDDENIDIIQIGFVNVFPDQSGGYPGPNFGNQCGSETYDTINGSSSLLLSHCPGIGPNITYCQSIGKKILLSIGGSSPNNSHLDNDVSAVEFATFLWEAFGPEDPSKTTPRPFGNACVDGFDFDIENVLISGEDSGDLDRGYGTMVNTLRTLYDTDKSKTYYISAAPQCLVPDAHLADAIETSPFDFLFVQFYNTPQCSARAYFDHSYEGTNTNISFASWVDFVHDHSYDPKTKVYLGLPAAPSVAYDAKMYLQANEANEIIKALQCGYEHEFGGVMIYEATFSQNNQINGQPYADVLKGYLENTVCTVSAPVTSSATVHSTRTASFSSALAVTSSVQAPTESGATTAYVSLSMSAYGSTPSPVGPSVSSSGLPARDSPSSGLYRNATFVTVSSAPASAVTSSTPTPITISPLPESTEFTSLTTYTTVTSCPVTTTQVQSGTTSIIVKTSLITSTITTCPRCSEQTESASVPVLFSNTSGSPGQVGTTAPAPSSSNSIALSPSGASPSSSSTPLTVPTTYITTTIVSTLTTTCSKATTFSLSPSGKVYTATANETLTIKDCPCTLTHTAIGYSAPTNGDFSSEHMSPGIPGGPATDANDFLTGTSYFGTPGISGAENAPSGPESGESNSSPQAGSSSAPEKSESTAEGSHGSSSPGSSGALNAGSQSTSNSESGTSSPGGESPGNAVSQSNSDSESAATSPSEASPGQAGTQSNSNSENFASSLSALSHGILNAGSPSNSNSESGASSPGSGNKAAVPQQSSPEQPEVQGSPSEEGAAGSVSKAGAQALASGVAGGHIPVVTMDIVPIPESSGEIAQSGKASQNGKSSGQANEQESGQQHEQQGGQQSGQQSGQQGNSASLAVNNSTAPVSPSGTFSTGPSGTAPASQGVGSGSPANSSQKEFKGAASRIGGSLFGIIAASAAILLL